MTDLPISADLLAEKNKAEEAALANDYSSLGEQLDRRGIDIDAMTQKVAAFPSPSRPGASARAARALPVLPAPASRAASSRSSTIAPSSTS